MTSSRVPFARSSPVSSSSRAPPSRRRASSPSSSPLSLDAPRIRARPRVSHPARPIATRVETHSHSSTGTPSRRRPRSNVDAETRCEERRDGDFSRARGDSSARRPRRLERARKVARERTRVSFATCPDARGRAGIARTGGRRRRRRRRNRRNRPRRRRRSVRSVARRGREMGREGTRTRRDAARRRDGFARTRRRLNRRASRRSARRSRRR